MLIVEEGTEGGGDDEVVVEEVAKVLKPFYVSDVPFHGSVGANGYFHLAGGELLPEQRLTVFASQLGRMAKFAILHIYGGIILKATSFNNSKEIPAEFGFGGGVEKKRNHFSWVGFLKER